jgi:hypothetical protein
MNERLSSGNTSNAAVDTSPLEAINRMLTGYDGLEQRNAAAGNLFLGDKVGVGFAVGDDNELKFAVGARDDTGRIQGHANDALMTVMDTSHDVKTDAADRAADAAARSDEVKKANMAAGISTLAAPILSGVEAISGAVPAITFASRIIGDVARRVTERKITKKNLAEIKAEYGQDTSQLYKDQLQRYSQLIEINGGRTQVLNEGEKVNEAQSVPERKLQEFVQGRFADYWTDLTTKRNSAEYQAEKRAELENDMSAAVAEYNAEIKKLDNMRGDFSANNLMQFADAGKDALTAKHSLEQVINGFNKTKMIFAEAASPLPAERITRMDQIANSLAGNIMLGALQSGIVAAAGTLSPFAPAAIAGAFSGVREAKRLNDERNRAIRKNSLGGQYDKEIAGTKAHVDAVFKEQVAKKEAKGKILSDDKKQKLYDKLSRKIGLADKLKLRDTLIETKTANEVISGFNTGLAAFRTKSGAYRSPTEDEEKAMIQSMADFDQRVVEQAAFNVPLISFSSKQSREQENNMMLKRRGLLQTSLIIAKARQSGVKPNGEGWEAAMEAAREQVEAQLVEAYVKDMEGKGSRLEDERREKNRAFAALKRNKVAGRMLGTALMVSIMPAAKISANSVFGAGSFGAKAGAFAVAAPLYVPNAARMAKSFGKTMEAEKKKVMETGLKDPTKEARRKELMAMLGTEQLNGARPQTEAANGEIEKNADGTESSPLPKPVELAPSFTPAADRWQTLRKDQEAFMEEYREHMQERGIADRERAQEIFIERTGAKLTEPAVEQLFWDSFYQYRHTPLKADDPGSLPNVFAPNRIILDPQAVADIMIEKFNANPDMAEVWAAEAESNPEAVAEVAEVAEADSGAVIEAGEEREELPELRVRRERATTRFKQKFADRYPGRALPSDIDMAEMFRRGVSAVTRAA